MRVSTDFDGELGALFRELVGGRHMDHRQRERRFKQQLDQAFRSPKLLSRIQFDRAVTLPVLGRELVVPYAYRNGALNLIKPQLFPAGEKVATRVASELAIDSDLLGREPESDGTQRKLIVIASFPASLGDATPGIEHLLTTYNVRVVPSDRVSEFVEEVEHEAHA
jgi:hypothetical protein